MLYDYILYWQTEEGVPGKGKIVHHSTFYDGMTAQQAANAEFNRLKNTDGVFQLVLGKVVRYCSNGSRPTPGEAEYAARKAQPAIPPVSA